MCSCSPAVVTANTHLLVVHTYHNFIADWQFIRVIVSFQLRRRVRQRIELNRRQSCNTKTAASRIRQRCKAYIGLIAALLRTQVRNELLIDCPAMLRKLSPFIPIPVVLMRPAAIPR
ncbi:hypothetical protein D3C85_1461140 [compost metagenome]